MDGSEGVGGYGMPLMAGMLEIMDSEIDFPGTTETSPEMGTTGETDTADGSDTDVLEKEGAKAAWAVRMPRPMLATVLGEGVILSQLKKE